MDLEHVGITDLLRDLTVLASMPIGAPGIQFAYQAASTVFAFGLVAFGFLAWGR